MTLDTVSVKRMALLALWLFLQTHWSASSFRITRGDRDSVWYGKDYHRMVNRTDDTMICNETDQRCRCDTDKGYNTVIYNMTNNSVKCVKDEDKAILGHDIYGEYIKNSSGGCLGVKDKKIVEVSCDENDLSLRWRSIQLSHILNVKTLTCLQWDKNSHELTVAQCNDASDDTQQWFKEPDTGKIVLYTNNPPKFETKLLYSNLSLEGEDRTYTGCYRVSGDKMLAVVKQAKDNEETNPIFINAPIFEQDRKKKCTIKKEASIKYAQTWNATPLVHQLFNLITKCPQTVELMITNSSMLFQKWSGTLMKLFIKCEKEVHGVILKIEGGTVKKTLNLATLLATSSATLSPTSSPNESTTPLTPVKEDSKMSSMLYIIPIVVLICLLIVAFVIVFYYRRRRKRVNAKEGLHLYEESTASKPKDTYEDPLKMIKMKKPNPDSYDSPGTTIPSGSLYDEPASGPPQPNPGQTPTNNNNFHYDYATREETSLLPLIMNGDVVFEDDPPALPKPRQAGQSGGKPYYHTLHEDKSETADSNAEQPEGNPLYHTLEANKSDLSDPAGKEPNENGKKSQEQPVYHTLESNYEEIEHRKPVV